MKLLLDTHILLWAAAGTLPEQAVPLLTAADNILYFSPASIWEIVIKKALVEATSKLNRKSCGAAFWITVTKSFILPVNIHWQ